MVAGEVDEEEEEEEQVHYSCRSLLHQERTNNALALLLSRSFSLAPSSLFSFSPAPSSLSLSHSLLHLLPSLFLILCCTFFCLAPREINHALALHCIVHFLLHQHVHYSFSLAPTRCTLFVQSITHLVHQVLCTFEGIGVLPHLANVLRERAREPASECEHSIHHDSARICEARKGPGQQDESHAASHHPLQG